jgi:hypothetical protein
MKGTLFLGFRESMEVYFHLLFILQVFLIKEPAEKTVLDKRGEITVLTGLKAGHSVGGNTTLCLRCDLNIGYPRRINWMYA